MRAFALNVKWARIALYGAFLFLACSKSDVLDEEQVPVKPVENEQLVVTVSAIDIDLGEEVKFTVTAGGEEVDADIYIGQQKIAGKKHVFNDPGNYEVVAKKENYKESDQMFIEVHALDIYVSGIQNVTESDASVPQVLLWKNKDLFYELTDGTAFASTAGIALHNDDIYVGGTENVSYTRVAKYWKNNIAYPLTDGRNSATVNDITVDAAANVYVIGTDDNPHRPVIWQNGKAKHVSNTFSNRYARAITTKGDDLYIVGNSSSSANEPSFAVMWENGSEIKLTNGVTAGRALHVAVDDGDVYVLGDENNKGLYETGGQLVPKYWKDGLTYVLDEKPTDRVDVLSGGIAVQNGDVYVLGMLIDGTARYARPTVWKNGERLYELTDGTFYAAVSGIVISGGNVYVIGIQKKDTRKDVATVWKNNEVFYTLTDGTRRAILSGIAIRRSK